MTDELDRYLQTEYPVAVQHTEEIRHIMEEVLNVFGSFFLEDQKTWPYQLVNNSSLERPEYSFSTTAMILFALSLATGRIRNSSLAPAAVRWTVPAEGEEGKQTHERLTALVGATLDGLIDQSRQLEPRADGPPPLTISSTFGRDDPFTMTWLLEALWDDSDADRQAFRERLEDRAWQAVHHALAADQPLRAVLQIEAHERPLHAFPLLRILQLGESLSQRRKGDKLSRTEDLSRIRELLFERVHLHLSQMRIPQSGFDAADLAFSLEGWILSTPVEPDFAVVDRAFEVLRESQERTPYWRPLRPFKVTRQGLALLPQSVEIANSLLRICAAPVLSGRAYFSQHLDLVRQYTWWLLGRVFRGFVRTGENGGLPFAGWESDHTYTLDRIHLWQTSQVVIFLQHYVGMFDEDVAQTSLQLAGFPRLALQHGRPKEDLEVWVEWKQHEPLTTGSAQSPYRVYEQIEADFVTPRLAGKEADPSFSMLLYGPPGTGKSRIAETLAITLGFPLLTVTPSDFLTAGAERMEARTKAVFRVLEQQTDVVVLFDEFDQLLLDRDTKLYREQGDVFKLLTPGMLTKLNDLAKLRRVVLIVATNYYERIDRAIKRPGRIDARYLILPPDLSQRERHLAKVINAWSSVSSETRSKIAQETVRFTYKELEDLWAHVRRRRTGLSSDALGDALLEALQRFRPIITLEGYALRLFEPGHDKHNTETVEHPLEEFGLLTYLELEARGQLPDRPEWLRTALQWALDESKVADGHIAETLRHAIEPGRHA